MALGPLFVVNAPKDFVLFPQQGAGWAFVLDVFVEGLVGLVATLVISRHLDTLIQEYERTEAERQHTERAHNQLAAVQVTARAVAHGINQPLAAIYGYVSILRDTPVLERDDADLDKIAAQVQRAATLVRQLQAVSRFQTVPYASGEPMLDLRPDVSS
jgi:signal transduction histidine kinase